MQIYKLLLKFAWTGLLFIINKCRIKITTPYKQLTFNPPQKIHIAPPPVLV